MTAAAELLLCPTPPAWLDAACRHRATLLIDHANCEKKAAGNALSLLYRYVGHPDLLSALSPLAREELLHFEQVVALMRAHSVQYVHVTPSRYAQSMKALVRAHEPVRLMDTLLMGAVVEARSCERFACLARVFDDDLGRYYGRLVVAEERHFRDYLELARRYGDGSLQSKLDELLQRDCELIELPDSQFRFHSGVPDSSLLSGDEALEVNAILAGAQ